MNEHAAEADALLDALEQEIGHIVAAFTVSEGIAVASSPRRQATQVLLMSYEREGSGFSASVLETQEVSGDGTHAELEEAALLYRQYVRDNIPDEAGRTVIEKQPQVVGDLVRMWHRRHGGIAYPAVWLHGACLRQKSKLLGKLGST